MWNLTGYVLIFFYWQPKNTNLPFFYLMNVFYFILAFLSLCQQIQHYNHNYRLIWDNLITSFYSIIGKHFVRKIHIRWQSKANLPDYFATSYALYANILTH